MIRWLIVPGVVLLLIAISRVIAIGRKNPETLSEAKAALLKGQPERFTRTQEPDVAQLDMTPKKFKLVRRA